MYHCIGCGRGIDWDGRSPFSYTCPCGGAIFADETGNPAFPSSALLGLAKGLRLPHLDDLVGLSGYTSPEKEEMVQQLRAMGFTWMEECKQCRKDGTWARRERSRRLRQRLDEIRRPA